MNSIGHVVVRARALRASLNRANSGWSDGAEGELTDLFEHVVADLNHLRKALLLPGLPSELKSARFDADLDERVRHTRNLWEHWENPGPSMDWFERRYPGRTPWVLESAGGGDITVSGVILVSEIQDVLERVDQALGHRG